MVLVVKNTPVSTGDEMHRFDAWVGKIPWRCAWQPAPVFLPGESHGLGPGGGSCRECTTLSASMELQGLVPSRKPTSRDRVREFLQVKESSAAKGCWPSGQERFQSPHLRVLGFPPPASFLRDGPQTEYCTPMTAAWEGLEFSWGWKLRFKILEHKSLGAVQAHTTHFQPRHRTPGFWLSQSEGWPWGSAAAVWTFLVTTTLQEPPKGT